MLTDPVIFVKPNFGTPTWFMKTNLMRLLQTVKVKYCSDTPSMYGDTFAYLFFLNFHLFFSLYKNTKLILKNWILTPVFTFKLSYFLSCLTCYSLIYILLWRGSLPYMLGLDKCTALFKMEMFVFASWLMLKWSLLHVCMVCMPLYISFLEKRWMSPHRWLWL